MIRFLPAWGLADRFVFYCHWSQIYPPLLLLFSGFSVFCFGTCFVQFAFGPYRTLILFCV